MNQAVTLTLVGFAGILILHLLLTRWAMRRTASTRTRLYANSERLLQSETFPLSRKAFVARALLSAESPWFMPLVVFAFPVIVLGWAVGFVQDKEEEPCCEEEERIEKSIRDDLITSWAASSPLFTFVFAVELALLLVLFTFLAGPTRSTKRVDKARRTATATVDPHMWHRPSHSNLARAA